MSMKKLIRVANIMPNMTNYDHLFTAAEEMFKQELDFEREKKFYKLYRKSFKHNKNIVIPNPVEEFCTKKILVTEWVDGVNLQKWLEAQEEKNSSKAKNKIASLMFDVIFTEILLLNHIQSDPNPGNFLVTKDNKLVLIDFGATQALSFNLVENYVNLFRAGLKKNRGEVLRYAKKMSFIETADSDEIRNSFLNIFYLALEPFLEDSYSWEDCNLSKRINSETFVYMKKTKFRAPSGEILFMNRRLAGNLIMLEKLGSNFSARDIFLKILEEFQKIQDEKNL